MAKDAINEVKREDSLTREAQEDFRWPTKPDINCPEITTTPGYADWILEEDPDDPFNLDDDEDGKPCEPWP